MCPALASLRLSVRRHRPTRESRQYMYRTFSTHTMGGPPGPKSKVPFTRESPTTVLAWHPSELFVHVHAHVLVTCAFYPDRFSQQPRTRGAAMPERFRGQKRKSSELRETESESQSDVSLICVRFRICMTRLVRYAKRVGVCA